MSTTIKQLTYSSIFSLLIAFFCASTSMAQAVLPPVANAGGDVSASENTLLNLDGSASSDPQGLALTYLWTQVATSSTSPIAHLVSPNSAILSLIVPSVNGLGGMMTFQLTVTNSAGLSSSALANVTIVRVNVPPIASVTAPAVVAGGSVVTIDGSASYDPNGDTLSFTWSQIGGSSVALNFTDPVRPTFIAPISASTITYSFRLDVSDGKYISSAFVDIVVTAAIQPPVANAGANQTVSTSQVVTLNGTASTDPQNDILTYQWTQTSGPNVTLNLVDPSHPTFTAPATTSTLVFSLVVNNGTLNSTAASTVSIFVFPDAQPNCANAQANKTQVWPPNHTLARVKIRGLSGEKTDRFDGGDDGSGDDGDGNADSDDNNEDSSPLQVRVTSVTQDEPTTGTGPGDVGPDAVTQSVRPNGQPRVKDLILIRRERSDTGDGRVYQINFTATNTQSGLACTGKVTVCAPTKRGKKGLCVDSGQKYNSKI